MIIPIIKNRKVIVSIKPPNPAIAEFESVNSTTITTELSIPRKIKNLILSKTGFFKDYQILSDFFLELFLAELEPNKEELPEPISQYFIF
jgi:hypothetical protein